MTKYIVVAILCVLFGGFAAYLLAGYNTQQDIARSSAQPIVEQTPIANVATQVAQAEAEQKASYLAHQVAATRDAVNEASLRQAEQDAARQRASQSDATKQVIYTAATHQAEAKQATAEANRAAHQATRETEAKQATAEVKQSADEATRQVSVNQAAIPTATAKAKAKTTATVQPTATQVVNPEQAYRNQVTAWNIRHATILQNLYNSALEGRGWDDTTKAQVADLDAWDKEVGQYPYQSVPQEYYSIQEHLERIADLSNRLVIDLPRGFQINDAVTKRNNERDPDLRPDLVEAALNLFIACNCIHDISEEWKTIDRWLQRLGGS